jgi:hypothetical protein
MPCPAPFTVNSPFAYVALPARPTEPISPSDQPDGSGVTVKELLLVGLPFTVTVNGPVDAPDGTKVMMLVSLQLATTAVVPFNEIVLLPCVDPKPMPVMATSVPTTPEVGDTLVIPNPSSTVKLMPLLATPDADTTTFPVVASAGTVTTMLVALQLVGVASVPLKLTVPVP